MGHWGSGLYQNDVSSDVRETYLQILKDINNNLKATNIVIDQYSDYISDDEDCIYFWLSLADTQWCIGRLLPNVKEKALYQIEKHLAFDDKKFFCPISKKTLVHLKEKLMQSQPAEKHITKGRRYICTWNVGDIFAFQINNEKYHDHPLFHHWLVIQKTKAVSWYPHHIIPVITVRYSFETSCPSLNSLLTYPFIPISKRYTKRDDHGKPIGDFFYDYQLGLVMTSKRNIPDTFVYLGNAPVTVPQNAYQRTDYDENYFYSKWLCIEEDILKKYEKFIIR